jgi:antitoxin (DNA-binding transcriptional repressor) of toxin-antitoxin stability system
MIRVTVEDAARRLSELIHEANGAEILLIENGRPVAKIVALLADRPQPRRGNGRDLIAHIADDFDETPTGFEQQMP